MNIDICDKQLIVGGAASHAWDENGVCIHCKGQMPDRHTAFAQRLESLINAHSQENGSDTPDFILAQYLLGCLAVFNDVVKRREKWYGREAVALASIEQMIDSGEIGTGPYHGSKQ